MSIINLHLVVKWNFWWHLESCTINSFWDSISHDILYKTWKRVLLERRGSASHIPQLGKRDLLYVLFFTWGFCQKVKGSAGADPRNYREGSARFTMVLLAMIPKLVQRVLLHFFNLSRGFCQKDKGSASHDSQISRKWSAVCIVFH